MSKSNETKLKYESTKLRREEKVAEDFERHIGYLLNFWKYIGIYRINDFSSVAQIYLRDVIIVLFIGSNILLVISEIVVVPGDMNFQRLASTINPIGFHISGFVKWSYCLIKCKNFASLVAALNRCYAFSLEIDQTDIDYASHKTEMEKVSKSSKIFLHGWTYICLYGIIHWCVNPLLAKSYMNVSGDRSKSAMGSSLPYAAWYPWNVATTYGYLRAFAIQFVGAIASAIGMISFDTLYVSMLMIVCGQLRRLNVLLNNADNIYGKHTARANCLQVKLRRCVQYHSLLMNFLADLERFASPLMFVQCIQTLLVVCLLSFEASVVQVTADTECLLRVWSMMEYLLGLLIQLYIFCYYATQITFLATKVGDSGYACGWEVNRLNKVRDSAYARSDVQNLLQLLILCAQKPIRLTGGPFYILSLDTFRAVIGLAISNAMVLRQLSTEN